MCIGCEASRPDRANAVTATITEEGGLPVLELSTSPTGSREKEATPLEIAFRIGSVEDGFGHVADATTLNGDTLAVLDRQLQQIHLFDASGQLIRKLGRAGEGPGEYRDPWSIASIGDTLLVVRDYGPQWFTILTPGGDVVSTVTQVPDSDWNRIQFRGPLLRADWPFQMPEEDVTARLAGFTGGAFLYQTRADELRVPEADLPNLRVGVIRFSISGDALDTVLSGPVPPMRPKTGLPTGLREFDEPIYASRFLWTTGDGWVAFATPGDSAVTVLDAATLGPILTIRWPLGAGPVTEADRLTRMDWLYEHVNVEISAEAREEDANEHEWFAETAPEVAQFFGHGNLLWMGGWDPDASPRGGASSFLVVDVREPALVGVFKVPRTRRRVRHIAGSTVVTTVQDSLGVDFVEVYRVPAAGDGVSSHPDTPEARLHSLQALAAGTVPAKRTPLNTSPFPRPPPGASGCGMGPGRERVSNRIGPWLATEATIF